MAERTDTLRVRYEVTGDGNIVRSFGAVTGEMNKQDAAAQKLLADHRKLQDEFDKGGTGLRKLSDQLSKIEYAYNQGVISSGKYRSETIKATAGYVASTAAFKLLAGGIVAGTAALVGITKATADHQAEMGRAAERTGVNVKALSQLAYAAEQTDVSFASLENGLDGFNRGLSKNEPLLNKLGIATRDANKQLRDTPDILKDVAEFFAHTQDGAGKSALAMKLFGKSGEDLIPILDQGKQGLSDLADEADRFGKSVSEEQARNAQEFNDNLDKLKAIATGAAQQIGSALIPKVSELLGEFADGAEKAGDFSEAAQGIADTFDVLVIAAKLVYGTLASVGDIVRADVSFYIALANAALAAKDAMTFDFKGAADHLRAARQEASEAYSRIAGIPDNFNFDGGDGSSGKPKVKVAFAGVDPEPEGLFKPKTIDPNDVNPPHTPRTPRGSGDSAARDAERAAKRIRDAMADMQKTQDDWDAELQKEANPIAAEFAQRLAEIAKEAEKARSVGVPETQVAAKVEELKKRAEALRDSDIAKFQKEFIEGTQDMAAEMAGPGAQAALDYERAMAKVNEELQQGLITQDQYAARTEALSQKLHEAATQVTADLREQIEMLGMTAEQQEIVNNLKQAGVSANSPEGQQIIHLTELKQQLAGVKALADEAASTFVDLAGRVIDGSMSAEDAIKGFFDTVAKNITSFLLSKLAEKMEAALMKAMGADIQGQGGGGGGGFFGFLAGLLGNSASSSTSSGDGTGGWGSWAGALTAMFGGGRALGGPVQAGRFYEVNENAPELLTIGTRTMLMMGAQGGNVAPMPAYAGGGDTYYNINVPVQGMVDRHTRGQIADDLSRELRRTARNR